MPRPLLIIPLALMFDTRKLWLILLLHLLVLFFTAMVCHGELAKRRPTTRHLTEFYLWLSFGGMLGGMFSALVAPAVFDSALEYPLVLVLACLLRPAMGRKGRRQWLLDIVLPAGLVALYLNYSALADAWADVLSAWPSEVFDFNLNYDPYELTVSGSAIVSVTIGLILIAFSRRPLRFALGMAALLFPTILLDDPRQVIARERSFFGIYTVELHGSTGTLLLRNGTTTHGAQDIDPRYRRQPLTYYGRAGPLGQLFAAFDMQGRAGNIGAPARR
ncbi:MAG: hypothetical protein VCD50_13535 [Alphaproteobacteria bacterium]